MAQTTDRPPVDVPQLSDEQRRGGACAYCRIPVSTSSAVDLGEQRDEDGTRMFLRAHPECVQAER